MTKTGKSFDALLASGILANMLVCLAVWMAYGGNTVTEKVVGLILPITAFVAAGFEHSAANMYLLPYAYLIQGPTGTLSLADALGNMAGGSAVALAYGWVYAERRA